MDLKLPQLGEGAESGTVVNVFVKEGDRIGKDQPVLELENEKAVVTIRATAAGVVTKLFVRPGDKLSVGQRFLAISTGDDGMPIRMSPQAAGARGASRAPEPVAEPVEPTYAMTSPRLTFWPTCAAFFRLCA